MVVPSHGSGEQETATRRSLGAGIPECQGRWDIRKSSGKPGAAGKPVSPREPGDIVRVDKADGAKPGLGRRVREPVGLEGLVDRRVIQLRVAEGRNSRTAGWKRGRVVSGQGLSEGSIQKAAPVCLVHRAVWRGVDLGVVRISASRLVRNGVRISEAIRGYAFGRFRRSTVREVPLPDPGAVVRRVDCWFEIEVR
jgi:hypothetical protein